jgi:hypothetical protein
VEAGGQDVLEEAPDELVAGHVCLHWRSAARSL